MYYMIKSVSSNYYYNITTGTFVAKKYASKFCCKDECFAVRKAASKNASPPFFVVKIFKKSEKELKKKLRIKYVVYNDGYPICDTSAETSFDTMQNAIGYVLDWVGHWVIPQDWDGSPIKWRGNTIEIRIEKKKKE